MTDIDRDSPDYQMRVTHFLDETVGMIEEHGVSFIGVFPVKEGQYHFCYSIGRTLQGLPELIVTGVSSQGQGFLEFVCENWGDHPGPNVLWPIDEDGAMMTLPVRDEIAREHNTLARTVADVTETLQVVWRDDHGLWPWDKNDPTLPILDPASRIA